PVIGVGYRPCDRCAYIICYSLGPSLCSISVISSLTYCRFGSPGFTNRYTGREARVGSAPISSICCVGSSRLNSNLGGRLRYIPITIVGVRYIAGGRG